MPKKLTESQLKELVTRVKKQTKVITKALDTNAIARAPKSQGPAIRRISKAADLMARAVHGNKQVVKYE